MAPVRPKQRQTPAKKAASGRGVLFEDEFRTTKKDKRTIKHSTFVSKIEKTNSKPSKRRRASKKLVANLDSLADALPDAEETEQNGGNGQVNIIKHKTLRTRPGAMKRKEKLEKVERDRFVKNMAQLAGVEAAAAKSNTDAEQPSVSNRFAALRNFISQTMEQQLAFKK
ncbi:conserved hypothetical protein [Paecilomyces variotii No. 5]|uniref:Ribosome biogenesis protein SLX9 n=1 Tax=Byssochlamys spectabilis (strain No. 5 / NBRC 109023) TaxID=1356009 RepID=V5FBD0_BYSSN|nr:conserved hypothetical protein [Paecilomyces variotii No. 5]